MSRSHIFYFIWLSNLLTLSVPDEGYSRKHQKSINQSQPFSNLSLGVTPFNKPFYLFSNMVCLFMYTIENWKLFHYLLVFTREKKTRNDNRCFFVFVFIPWCIVKFRFIIVYIWFFFFFRMPTKFLKGEDNSRLKVLEVNGFCIPTCPYPTHEQEYLTLSNWKAMDNDILISAYPKSG